MLLIKRCGDEILGRIWD